MIEEQPDLPQETDQKSQVRLAAINTVGLSLEKKAEDARYKIEQARGVIAGVAVCSMELEAIRVKYQQEVDAERLDGDTAKKIMQVIQEVKQTYESLRLRNQIELGKAEGFYQGLSQASNHCEELFKQEDARAKSKAKSTEKRDGGRPKSVREVQAENK